MNVLWTFLACAWIMSAMAYAKAEGSRYHFRDSEAYHALSEEDRGKLEQVYRDLMMLWGALDRYSDHHGNQAPDRLEQLVPLYLAELPSDPFATAESAVKKLPAGQVTSKEGWGYRYKAGSGQAWCISSVGLPEFPNAKNNYGLYVCKGFWSGNDIPFAPTIQRVPEGYELSLVSLPQGWLAYYERHGRGPKLLLIPGSFNDYRIYNKAMATLSPEFHVIIMDLRGHGGSWPPAEEPSIELFAQDVLRVADALKLERFYVGGHSIGGMIAIEVARQRPEVLAGVISIEGWTHHEVQAEAFGGAGHEQMTPEQIAEREAHRQRVLSRLSDEQRHAFAQAWRKWDGLPTLQKTELPVLEIWGDRGRGPQSREVMRIPDRPNIQLRWVSGAAHSLLVQTPATVAEMINNFILGIEPLVNY